MDAYACLIKTRGSAQAADMLADLCRTKDLTISTLQTALRDLGGASVYQKPSPTTPYAVGVDTATEDGRLP